MLQAQELNCCEQMQMLQNVLMTLIQCLVQSLVQACEDHRLIELYSVQHEQFAVIEARLLHDEDRMNWKRASVVQHLMTESAVEVVQAVVRIEALHVCCLQNLIEMMQMLLYH